MGTAARVAQNPKHEECTGIEKSDATGVQLRRTMVQKVGVEGEVDEKIEGEALVFFSSSPSSGKAGSSSSSQISTASTSHFESSATGTGTGSAAAPSTTGNGTGTEGSGDAASCFPRGSAKLPATGAPSGSRASWWCPDSTLYGFMGFSYPLEADSCSDPSNGYDSINKDLANMKSQFGASMVRVYAPQCRDVSVWENLVKACVSNNMGLIVQVWWGFQDDVLLRPPVTQHCLTYTRQKADYSQLQHTLKSHLTCASFGSEPIGDGVDGGTDQFITDLKAFRSKMNGFGIPVGISEDWDRPGVMSASGSGSGLGPTGQKVKDATDLLHTHIMPYYHPSEAPTAASAWSYIQKQLTWYKTNVGQANFVTESQWASAAGGHSRGSNDDAVNLNSFTTYWNSFASNCAAFKALPAGWFVHTYSDTFEPVRPSWFGAFLLN
ncbi:hypothetical protein T439DRAFT_358203 [Meredithblackwellia eburnea MCA 4105]